MNEDTSLIMANDQVPVPRSRPTIRVLNLPQMITLITLHFMTQQPQFIQEAEEQLEDAANIPIPHLNAELLTSEEEEEELINE